MGAALSYYTVFSPAPLLVIVISVAGLIFGADAVRGAIFGQIDDLMGVEAAKDIQDLLASVSRPSIGLLGTVLGVVMLLIGATTVFGELQDALNRIWRAPVRATASGGASCQRALPRQAASGPLPRLHNLDDGHPQGRPAHRHPPPERRHPGRGTAQTGPASPTGAAASGRMQMTRQPDRLATSLLKTLTGWRLQTCVLD